MHKRNERTQQGTTKCTWENQQNVVKKHMGLHNRDELIALFLILLYPRWPPSLEMLGQLFNAIFNLLRVQYKRKF